MHSSNHLGCTGHTPCVNLLLGSYLDVQIDGTDSTASFIPFMISYSKQAEVCVQSIWLLYVRVVSECGNVKCLCPSLSLSPSPSLL